MHNNRTTHVYAIITFLILALSYAYFLPKWGDWNANSRANLVYAVVDQGVLHIDDYHENTGDKACYPGPYDLEEDTCEGHYYTDKSLGPSLVAIPFYVAYSGLTTIIPVDSLINSENLPGNFADTLNPEGRGAIEESIQQGMALTFITFFAMSVPSAILGVAVFLFALRFTERPINAFVLALAYGLATIAFPYSNTLMQHQLAAFGAFVGFYLLWRVIYEQASLRWLWVVGLLFSLTVITDYPMVLVLALIFLWAVAVFPNRLALYRVVIAAIPLGLLFAAYNYAIFETIMPVGYDYSTLWQDVHSEGFFSLTMPSLERLYGLTFSPSKGVFLVSPFLLLFVPGLWMMWRKGLRYRHAALLLGLIIAAQFLFYSASVMWWGGHTIGPRYLTSMLPFMVLPIIFVFNYLFARTWGILVTALLIGLSGLHVWIQTIAGQSWPPTDILPLTIETMNAYFPVFDYSLPLLLEGNIARNYGGLVLGLSGLASVLPLLLAIALIGVGATYYVHRSATSREQLLVLEN